MAIYGTINAFKNFHLYLKHTRNYRKTADINDDAIVPIQKKYISNPKILFFFWIPKNYIFKSPLYMS